MKYLLIISITISLIILLCNGCNYPNSSKQLSDLGGVYSYDENTPDFSVEISAKLSAALMEGQQNFDKLRSWGIKRNSSHKLPDPDPGAKELLEKYGGIFAGDLSRKVIYLTFDEGYENGYTGKILDVLKDNGVKGVFFITGPYLKGNQELVRRMVEEGHIVGNHTIHHPSLPTLSDKEIEEEVLGLERTFFEKFGRKMKYLRPPKGEYSEKSLMITKKLGYTNVFWSFAYDDWYRDRIRGPEYAYKKVTDNLHNGAILLLHAVSKDNADALDIIIKGARLNGYEIGNIDEFLLNK